jgi:predicted RNA-binding Zn ribbon-like protein
VEIGSVGPKAPLLGEVSPIELMNTIWADRGHVHDSLADENEALAWLRAIQPRLSPLPSPVDDWLGSARPDELPDAVEALRRLRDALRRLAADATGDPRAAAASTIGTREAALAVLDGACAAAPTWSALRWAVDEAPARVVRTRGTVGQAMVAALAEQAVELFAGEPRTQLRACLAPGCVLYFAKDHPRREWCSAGCGNRARVARHYQRHHGARQAHGVPRPS